MNNFVTESVEETERRAGEIARNAKPGTVFLLEGDLGAGKTAFARGFARALGITEPVSSPTFTIVQEYPFGSGMMMYHMDLYRIDGPDSALGFGIDEFLYDKKAVSLIEWPERAEGLYPKDRTFRIIISRDQDRPDHREFEIRPLTGK